MEEDVYDDFVQRWECEAPPMGAKFQVLEDEWDESVDPPVRVIRKVRLIAVSLDAEGRTTP